MTWKELKQAVEYLNITDIDEYEIDIFGMFSFGSFGNIKQIGGTINNTPDGVYKELRLSINA